MTRRRELDGVVRSWLREDGHEDADRVLFTVLDQLDTTPQRRATWWPVRRTPPMSTFARFGLAAAAVVMIGLLAVMFLPGDNAGDTPAASATASPSPSPGFLAEGDMTSGGRYVIEVPHLPLNAIITLDAVDGLTWTSGGWFVNASPRGEAVAFFAPANVNSDACDQQGTLPNPPIGPTVEEFLAALEAQENSEMTAPVDVTVGDLTAKRVELRPSRGAPCPVVRWWVESCCGEPAFRGADTNAAARRNPDTVWVFDVDGQRVAVVGWSAAGPPAESPLLTSVIESLEFVPR